MISLEMIGCFSDVPGSQSFPEVPLMIAIVPARLMSVADLRVSDASHMTASMLNADSRNMGIVDANCAKLAHTRSKESNIRQLKFS